MTWFKVDDHLHDHRKARGIDLAAMGLWTMSGSWCGDQRTDGFIPDTVVVRWSRSWRKLAAHLVERGLWEPATVDGEKGWIFHDWHEHQPGKDDTTTDLGRIRWRRKNALKKNRGLCEAVITRDRNRCRYCDVPVNWADKKGAKGGTYDHVDPEGDNSLANVVVACRRCNGRKKDRTPEEAGMTLLPEPSGYQIRTESAPDPHQIDDGPLREAGRAPDRHQVGDGPGTGSGPGPAPDQVPGRDPVLATIEGARHG